MKVSGNAYMCVGARVAQWVRSLDLTAHTSLSPIRRGFAPSFVNYKKGCSRLAAANDKVYQLLAHGRWFSPGTPSSSTTKAGRHDIAEILLKVALKHQISINQNHESKRQCIYVLRVSILFLLLRFLFIGFRIVPTSVVLLFFFQFNCRWYLYGNIC